jgi:class 3 adenylate cyclase/predicted ATPase
LLKAIAALSGGAAPMAVPALTATPPQAERRQLTLLFADLVGSTALSAGLDPEDMRALLRGYQDAVAGAIARYEGVVAKLMGDGVLAYFGFPRAHEDEAERAVRAGLDVVIAVGRLHAPGGAPLGARVGIATGLVVVGDLIGEGAAQERAVVGDTPNLAARLQALAEPATVVIAPGTRRLVGGHFEYADLGAHAIKGLAEPVRVWRVLGPGRAAGRFEAREAAAGPSPLVGREEELALLRRHWERAREGEGQVVLLSGEPGIGKSRLVRGLRDRLAGEPHTPLLYQCSPYHTGTALHPVIEHLERAAGFARADAAEERLAKLEALLARSAEDVGVVAPLLAALLAIPAEGRYPALELTPQRRKEVTLRALVDRLAGLAARGPVLAVLEDAHWGDPTTLELFGRVVDRARDLPVLVVITFRPEFAPSWAGRAHVAALALSRLGRREAAALVERVSGHQGLPGELLGQILAKTDGVPLFVEELTKAVLEAGLVEVVGDSYVLKGPLPALAVPDTLHASLLARLDRLAPVREVAQVAACIGRGFSHELLAAVTPMAVDELRRALEGLAEAELVFRHGDPPDATYTFKHALVRDAAYQSLLRSRRQQLHARIAQVMEERFPEVMEAQPEVLARHCVAAGLVERAVAYWHEAGRLAVRRSAMAEAVAHFAAALELLASLPAAPERDRTELELRLALGAALNATRGWASPEMGRAYARARELCQELGEDLLLPRAPHGLSLFHVNRAEMDAALEVAEELLRRTAGRGDAAIELIAHRMVGVVLLFRGSLGAAVPHFERVRAAYDRREHALAVLVPQDTGVVGRNFLALASQLQGHPGRALALSLEAGTLAAEVGQPLNSASALHLGCLFHQLRGERALVGERSAALVELATEQGFPHFVGTGTFFRGWAMAAGGAVEQGIAEMRNGLAAKRATGAEVKVPYYLGLLGAAETAAGQLERALLLLADALETVRRTGERWFEAELHRLEGEALLRTVPANIAGAESCFNKAIEVARRQGARWWELRAVTSLARLWAGRGESQEAHDLLAPIYGWFTEGLDTADLRGAKALLDGLQRVPS